MNGNQARDMMVLTLVLTVINLLMLAYDTDVIYRLAHL